ncbi:MAG: hypothetical protein J6T15_04990 [Bacilli bacterium]|nr:hypothetical protein [Bacilli bacterium]
MKKDRLSESILSNIKDGGGNFPKRKPLKESKESVVSKKKLKEGNFVMVDTPDGPIFTMADVVNKWNNTRPEDKKLKAKSVKPEDVLGKKSKKDGKKLKESADTVEKVIAEVNNLNNSNLTRGKLKKALADLVGDDFNWYRVDPNDDYEFSGYFTINDEDYEFCVNFADEVYAEFRNADGDILNESCKGKKPKKTIKEGIKDDAKSFIKANGLERDLKTKSPSDFMKSVDKMFADNNLCTWCGKKIVGKVCKDKHGNPTCEKCYKELNESYKGKKLKESGFNLSIQGTSIKPCNWYLERKSEFDSLYCMAIGSDNLDYIKEKLDVFYNMAKDSILDPEHLGYVNMAEGYKGKRSKLKESSANRRNNFASYVNNVCNFLNNLSPELSEDQAAELVHQAAFVYNDEDLELYECHHRLTDDIMSELNISVETDDGDRMLKTLQRAVGYDIDLVNESCRSKMRKKLKESDDFDIPNMTDDELFRLFWEIKDDFETGQWSSMDELLPAIEEELEKRDLEPIYSDEYDASVEFDDGIIESCKGRKKKSIKESAEEVKAFWDKVGNKEIKIGDSIPMDNSIGSQAEILDLGGSYWDYILVKVNHKNGDYEYVAAWAPGLYNDKLVWGQGHYFDTDLDSARNYFKNKVGRGTVYTEACKGRKKKLKEDIIKVGGVDRNYRDDIERGIMNEIRYVIDSVLDSLGSDVSEEKRKKLEALTDEDLYNIASSVLYDNQFNVDLRNAIQYYLERYIKTSR